MKKERLLFICSTKYLLFNAIHVRMHMFPNIPADIIVDFRTEETMEYYQRVRESGLFEKVAYLRPKIFDLHEYIRARRKGDQNASFKRCLKNTYIKLYKKYKNENNPIAKLNDLLAAEEDLDFYAYTGVFGQGNNETVRNVLKIVRGQDCEINTLEEGDGTYINGCICDMVESHNIYVYKPELISYASDKLKRIPPVDKEDEIFIRKVNHIFNYKQGRREISNKIILFDTYAEPMPDFYKNHKILSRTLLRNAYKKHKVENALYEMQRNVYRAAVDCERDVLIKLHPSNKRLDVYKEFRGGNVEIMASPQIPWEVFCLNNSIAHNVFVATVTAALKSNYFITGGNDDNKYVVVTFDLEGLGISATIVNLYKRLGQMRNDGNMYYPCDINEYKNVMKRLTSQSA